MTTHNIIDSGKTVAAGDKSRQAALLDEPKRPWYVRAGIGLLVLAVVGAAGGYWFFGRDTGTKISYVTEKAVRGDLNVTVTADGTLNPMRTVTLGSELSGIVRRVNVDVNDTIKTGQTLIELDTRNLEAKVLSARASVASAKARLAESEATLNEAKIRYRRLSDLNKLSGGKMPSRADLDEQSATVKTAEASVASAKAAIDDAQASLKTAETDLSKAEIKSPIDGVVLARSVEPGYAVAASLQAVELLSLATDLRELELRVDVDEADIGVVQPGQPAYFTVSAYPDRRFPAALKKVAYGSTETENVVTYTAYLDVANANLLLRPGMTASATISTAHRDDVLLVPNSALRFKPRIQKEESSFRMGPPHRSDAQKIAKEEGGHAQRQRTIYVLRSGTPIPVTVTTGLTDGTRTEVISGEIAEGEAIVVDQQNAAAK